MCSRLGILLLLLVTLSGPIRADTADVVWFEGSDRKMTAAITAARSTLDLFLARVTGADGTVHPGAMLKVALPVTDNPRTTAEHVWVAPFRPDGSGGFSGELLNVPVVLAGVQVGDTVAFGADQVSDWGFIGPDGLVYGGYTLRVMLAREPDLAAQMMPLSRSTVPADW